MVCLFSSPPPCHLYPIWLCRPTPLAPRVVFQFVVFPSLWCLSPSWNWFPSWLQHISEGLRGLACVFSFLCDNRAVVDILNAGTSKSSDVKHLLRLLTLAACRHNFVFSASHIPGRVNVAADALSRLRLQDFRRLVPEANPLPRLIPPALLGQLVPPS